MKTPLLLPLHPDTASYQGDVPDVFYGGVCPDSGEFISIRPDAQTIHEALRLMDELDKLKDTETPFSTQCLYAPDIGKMFGVLVCESSSGERGVLRAFSGMYEGRWTLPGFVPPTSDVETFDSLRLEIEAKIKVYTDKIKNLEAQSPAPGLEQAILKLKHERKELSWHLTDVIHAAYTLINVRGESRKQLDVWNQDKRPPTGMGDCCAPKLLQYAAKHKLRPIGLAEFWWGNSPPVHPRIERQFYSACERKCHPILGFMLQGLK